MPEPEKRDGTIQSISIAARFLRLLASVEHPLPLGTIAKQTETGSSTAHRYLQSLIKEGLASQDPMTGYYDLGPASLTLGVAAVKRVDVVEIASQRLKKLTNDTPISAGLAIWTERGPTLVRWYRSAYFSISSLGLGDVLPIDNTACGQVFQAFLPESRIAAARSQQPSHFRGKKPGKDRIESVRSSCWAEMTDHLLPNVTGQAVPVFDAQHEIACVMTSVTDLGRLSQPEDRHALFQCAKDVADETGGAEMFQGLEI